MKILVYGAGVIGSLLTHNLCVTGNDVSLLARGEWAEILKEKGLRMHHWLQRKDTIDHPMIMTEIDGNIHYDAAFTVMQYDQTVAIKEQLSRVWCDTLVMVGNQLSFDEMENYIGEMILGAHGRHSVSEAVMMEQGWNRLMEKKPDTFMMPNFESLKAMCPPLKEL